MTELARWLSARYFSRSLVKREGGGGVVEDGVVDAAIVEEDDGGDAEHTPTRGPIDIFCSFPSTNALGSIDAMKDKGNFRPSATNNFSGE